MKRTKIFSSICMLVLTLACLTFGVYSAVKTSFTASGTITFNNYGIDADVQIDIYGVENGTEVDSTDANYGTVTGLKKKTVLASTGSSDTARSAYQTNVITTTPTLTLGELKFDELNTTVAEEWASKIVLVISFTNYSKFDAQLSITQQSAAITNLTVTYGSKIKATKSTNGTTGVKSTSSLTITLTPTNTSTAVSGTFSPQITLQPLKAEKGDLIKMNLETTATEAGELTSTYRVLKVDGNIAEVVSMYTPNKGCYWVSDTGAESTADKNGKAATKYDSSTLDNYLNKTWYDTLTDKAKGAIVAKDITQYSYEYSHSAGSDTHASYANYSSKAVVYQDSAKTVTALTRNVYALDIEDIEEYFGGTAGENGKTAGTFGTTNIYTLFWNTETRPSSITEVWLRSAIAGLSYSVWGGSSDFDMCAPNGSRAARPAFKIDLSKIDWA